MQEHIPGNAAYDIDPSQISASGKPFIQLHKPFFDYCPFGISHCKSCAGAHIPDVPDMVIESFKFQEQSSHGLGLFS